MLDRFITSFKKAGKWSSLPLGLVCLWLILLNYQILPEALRQASVLWLAVILFLLGLPLSILLGIHESRTAFGLSSNELLLFYAAIVAWINVSVLWGLLSWIRRAKPKINRPNKNRKPTK